MNINNLYNFSSIKYGFGQTYKKAAENQNPSENMSNSFLQKSSPDSKKTIFKAICIAGLILGGVYTCKYAFGSKIQEFINGVNNKFTSNTNFQPKEAYGITPPKNVDTGAINKLNGGAIAPIKSDEEYINIMKSLVQDESFQQSWKIDGADIFDLGIQPYAGFFDIHSAINAYIRENRTDDITMNNIIIYSIISL